MFFFSLIFGQLICDHYSPVRTDSNEYLRKEVKYKNFQTLFFTWRNTYIAEIFFLLIDFQSLKFLYQYQISDSQTTECNWANGIS